MGICTKVHDLAEVVLTSKHKISSSQNIQLQILKLLPAYFEYRRLDAWEFVFQNALGPEESEVGVQKKPDEVDRLIAALFELGRFNMYSAFEAEMTWEYTQTLIQNFSDSGLTVDISQADCENW